MRHPRPEHQPEGDPCTRCTHPAAWHRIRHRPDHYRPSGPSGKHKPYVVDFPFFDTESWNGKLWGPSARKVQTASLIYMSCYSRGHHLTYENTKGIDTPTALTWMVETLPSDTRSPLAWFYGGYDMTLILRDLPPWLHWLLLHPDKRRLPKLFGNRTRLSIHPVKWQGFTLDWLSGMLTIAKGDRKVVLYDLCKFYQCSFLKALTEWQVGTDQERALIEREKKRRNTFSKKDFARIKHYCDLETRLGSELWRKLREAHDIAGLKPAKWLGPGQTAKSMLRGMYKRCYGDDKVKGELRWTREIRHARLRVPPEAWNAFACAFFGGRFENTHYGRIKGPLWSSDIASAYPDATRRLPCLVHGQWSHVKELPSKFDLACVRYRLIFPQADRRRFLHWAPLPFRDSDGSICYPVNSMGWAWWPEIQAAQRFGFRMQRLEAWVYKSTCNCPLYTRHNSVEHPESIEDYYRYRLKIGKNGPGIVVKLALNSVYGVKAQVLGIVEYRSLSPYQSFIEAGMITSLTRARLLQAMLTLGPANVLMVNTDSVTSRVAPPWPDSKELGGLEVEKHPKGLTCVKQGMYFDPSFEKLRARGVGRAVLERNAKTIEKALARWIAGGPDLVKLRQTRDYFHGQRECVDVLQGVEWQKAAFNAYHGKASKDEAQFKKRNYYGTWEKTGQEITFTPLPKREAVLSDGRLLVRDMRGAESAPYSKALGVEALIRSEEAEADRAELDFPDGGYDE